LAEAGMERTMNKTDQKKVSRMISRLQEMHSELDDIVSSMDDKISSRSEKFADSDKGQQEQEDLSALQYALGAIETAIEYFGDFDLRPALRLLRSRGYPF